MSGGRLISDAVYSNVQLVPRGRGGLLYIKDKPLLTYCEHWYYNGQNFYSTTGLLGTVTITPSIKGTDPYDLSNRTNTDDSMFPGWFINPSFLGYDFTWTWNKDEDTAITGSTYVPATVVGGGALRTTSRPATMKPTRNKLRAAPLKIASLMPKKAAVVAPRSAPVSKKLRAAPLRAAPLRAAPLRAAPLKAAPRKLTATPLKAARAPKPVIPARRPVLPKKATLVIPQAPVKPVVSQKANTALSFDATPFPNSQTINVDVKSKGESVVKTDDELVAYYKDSGNVDHICGVATATSNIEGNVASGNTDSFFFST